MSLRRPHSLHLSLLSALPSRSISHSQGPAGSPPGFLKVDWRSGFADSNPSSLCGDPHNRKNWLFVGSDKGGETAAVLMSLCTTCKNLGIDPQAYLRDVLDRISTHPARRIEELLPDRWQGLRQAGGTAKD